MTAEQQVACVEALTGAGPFEWTAIGALNRNNEAHARSLEKVRRGPTGHAHRRSACSSKRTHEDRAEAFAELNSDARRTPRRETRGTRPATP